MKLQFTLIILVMMFLSAGLLLSQSATDSDLLLRDMAKNITAHKGKNVTLVLKLKNYNHIFERITFYDLKNYDIQFDISDKKSKKKFKKHLLQLHEGMRYSVTFIVTGGQSNGIIYGRLVEFQPIVLKKIP